MESVTTAEKIKYNKPTEMFMDVYDKPSQLLDRQMKDFLEHVKANKEHYPLNNYEKL